MTEEQRKQNVTVRASSFDEFCGAHVVSLEVTGEQPDVLDPNSYYLDVDA